MQRDKAVLLDIKNACHHIREFTHRMEKNAFIEDLKTQSAVLHKLLVIGEAVKRLSPDFRVKHPEIPWSLIAGMRDKLVHGYDIVDLDAVWETVYSDVPKLLCFLENLNLHNNPHTIS